MPAEPSLTDPAAWMLYHGRDLHATLGEVRRVLRPGGTFAATTTGDRHLGELLREAGVSPIVTQFSSENGGDLLRLHFGEVPQRDVTTWATFPDHAAVAAYLASFDPSLARGLPPSSGHGDSRASRRSSSHADEDTGGGMRSGGRGQRIHPVCERPTNAHTRARTLRP